MNALTHAGSLRPYAEFYSRVAGKMSQKEFRVALKTTGCYYVLRGTKVMLDEEMWEKFKEKMEGK